ncbi:hypothetical protein EMIHUDRAFT_209549 [Emiliania huxleyi CCMP1516]|uniref:SAM domain-containing protein n=2 Tax=Emiliania huxleyi TaxID=2903 RepID=A0A0D3J5W6_EMIH1|nr:hypothetical protein EMIHUDRAFT_209549 [Emiliania huxleyi CCMP1516]EOD18901.1 hypothetical protein EMIHUDRAFT_209549 [Emiliania huxleyi CCMP1516]|eukprot:XP_005771330.1 hypothetical protein EMIHUDRAFT_209549 [Emiliania huxleyi CCMP1516]
MMEDALSDLLAGLGLSRYAPIFEEEAITEVALLKSIGSTTFVSSMAELSMDEYAAEALRAELFGAEAPRSAPSVRPGLLGEESDDELALEENEEGGGARGAAVDVTGVSAATAAGLTVEGTLRKSGRPVSVRLRHRILDEQQKPSKRHLTSYYDAEEHEGTAEQDALIRSEMASAAAEERLRLQRLSGAAGWCQLVRELGSEVEAAVGVGCELTRYPAVYVDKIEAVATSCLLAMRGAAAVGLGFDGTAPFAEHVWVQGPPEGARRAADWSVVVGEVEPLEERDPSERFSAKDLVRSALGEWLREWWRSTAPKLSIVDGRTPHEGYARVLGRYGVLNWLLFGWADEQLDGESILQLVQHGPVSERSAEEREAAQRRWAAFTQEAFVRLGPRRFDEMNAQIGQMNDGEISVDDLLARARYFMCPDNEDLHAALGQMIRG